MKKGIRELVSDGLAARGARVECGASGEEALCLLDTRAYEVVICDVEPPGNPARRDFRPGVVLPLEQWAGRFAQHSQRPLFLFMTGELVEEGNVENLPAGVRTLQKPFRISDLVTVLNESLMSTTSGGAAGSCA